MLQLCNLPKAVACGVFFALLNAASAIACQKPALMHINIAGPI